MPERRQKRIQSNKDLVRAMLDFHAEDDEGEVPRELDGMEELERGCRMRRRSRPVAEVAAVIASSTTNVESRRESPKRTTTSEVSPMSISNN